MSVSLTCPLCGNPVTILKSPVGLCPSCQGAWSDGLRLWAEEMLEREKVGRPMLLTKGMYVALAIGGMLLLMLLLASLNAGNMQLVVIVTRVTWAVAGLLLLWAGYLGLHGHGFWLGKGTDRRNWVFVGGKGAQVAGGFFILMGIVCLIRAWFPA